MNTLFISLLIIGTIVIIYFSWWASLQEKRFHGIYRFFAFESIFITVLLNAGVWFANPFSGLQILSWFLLLGSILLAIHGFYLLKIIGKPKGKFENTTQLIIQGAYKYIRHPLYGSLVLFGLGAYCKAPNATTTLLAAINLLALMATAKVEEKEMIARFGDEYIRYLQKTKMFIPFVF